MKKRTLNKFLVIATAIVLVPAIATYLCIRHPRRCWRSLRNSWLLVFRGKDVEED